MTTPDQLFAYLDDLGISHATVSHPPLFTVEQSQSLRGAIPGGHTKNLFLRDKKQAVFLVVAEEDAEIDLQGLHRVLGASGRISLGSTDLQR
jgi:Ala-tRNA(Pro) deacylase